MQVGEPVGVGVAVPAPHAVGVPVAVGVGLGDGVGDGVPNGRDIDPAPAIYVIWGSRRSALGRRDKDRVAI